jgi:hypothetical protein
MISVNTQIYSTLCLESALPEPPSGQGEVSQAPSEDCTVNSTSFVESCSIVRLGVGCIHPNVSGHRSWSVPYRAFGS